MAFDKSVDLDGQIKHLEQDVKDVRKHFYSGDEFALRNAFAHLAEHAIGGSIALGEALYEED
jgi:hypothetical protein